MITELWDTLFFNPMLNVLLLLYKLLFSNFPRDVRELPEMVCVQGSKVGSWSWGPKTPRTIPRRADDEGRVDHDAAALDGSGAHAARLGGGSSVDKKSKPQFLGPIGAILTNPSGRSTSGRGFTPGRDHQAC